MTRYARSRPMTLMLAALIAAFLAPPETGRADEAEPREAAITLAYGIGPLAAQVAGENASPVALEDALVEIAMTVRYAVSPNAWKEKGGTEASLEIDGDIFAITAPYAIHQQVLSVLQIVQRGEAEDAPEAEQQTLPLSDAETLAALRQPISVDFDDIPWPDAMQHVAEKLNLNIAIERRELEETDADPSQRISLSVRDQRGDVVLSTLASSVEVDPFGDGFAVGVQPGQIVITTAPRAVHLTPPRVYDAADLIDAVFQKKRQEYASDADARDDATYEVMDLLRESVDMDNWRNYGGRISSMQELNEHLIVRTTLRNHVEIERLLATLRERLAR